MKTLISYRARFWARFPRLSYWMGARSTRAAIAAWVAAGLCGDIAEGDQIRVVMWLPAMLLAITTVRLLVIGARHAMFCPCVTASADSAPEDDVERSE